MGRKIKRCQKKCQKHTFLLKPVHYSAVFSRELQASFCPTSEASSSITPKFNNDKRYFTVSFYLPVDNQKLSKNVDFYQTEHQKYKMDHISEKSQIFQAKPKPKYSYCNVCKLDYDDYLEHIRSSDHKKRVKDNQFSFYIREICEKMNKQTYKTQQMTPNDQTIETTQKKIESFLTSLTLLNQNLQLNKEPKLSLNCQAKQRIQPLPSYKSFVAFSQFNEQKNPFHVDQHELVMNNPPFSPLKRYSEVTEGIRLVSNIRPIILHGSQHDLNF